MTTRKRDSTPDHLHYLLGQIAAAFPADALFVYDISADGTRLELIAFQSETFEVANFSADTQTMLARTIRLALEDAISAAQMEFLHHGVDPSAMPHVLSNDLILRTPFGSGIIFPLGLPHQVSGVLAVFARAENAYARKRGLKKITPLVGIIESLLEKRSAIDMLEQNLSGAQALMTIAQAATALPSPQEVVDLLHESMFGSHITSCALMLYGPMPEEQPDAAPIPYEYMEIRGTWSKRVGSGVATGLKVYLRDYPQILDRIERERIVVYRNAEELKAQLDPFTRGLLRAERVRSAAVFSLQSAERTLGLLAIATHKPYDFPTRELNQYRMVAEFLAVNSMARMLQQQHDRVQQARAALLDAVTDGVVMVTPRANIASVLTVNAKFTSMFNVAENRAEQLSLIELLNAMQIPEGVRAELRRIWQNTPVRDPNLRRGEFSMIAMDGRPLDIEWYSAPVYQTTTVPNAPVLGRIYIFHDVSAERAAARLRADFLSRVSHELRTPLTSIRGFAEFILEATGDQLPDVAREYTQIILQSARHLNHVFNDIIEVSRADAGQLKLNRVNATMTDIVIDVVARMELQHKARKQKVVMDLNDDLPPVNVDVDRIVQVLTNLLTNAIKYAPEGGKITVQTVGVEHWEHMPQYLNGTSAPPDVTLPAILTIIRDDGKGLSAEDAEKVFLPFFRTEESKRAKIEGVGLGLSVTRSLVEMHRGKIWAIPRDQLKGADAQGAWFVFTLPTAR